MTDIDHARARFEDYKNKFAHYKVLSLTESDTRSKLLDIILEEILGWEEDNIDREGYVRVGYYDYKIGIPGFKFVIEAKKTLTAFAIPTKNNVATLGTLKKGNESVVKQIRDYLGEVGLQYGVITNGHQFFIAKFINTDGTDWNKNKAVIFDGLDDIQDRFIEFYNVLSKVSIIENGTFNFLNEAQSFSKSVLLSIHDRDGELIRNSLSSNLVPVLNGIFGEIYKYEVLDNEELIKECFVENEEIKKNKSEIEKIFDDLPPILSEVIPVRNTQNTLGSIKSEIEEHPISLKEIEPPKPIIIIGSKGAGKTTFINYLFKISLSEDFRKERPYVYLDFRKYNELDFQQNLLLIYKDILELIYEKYEQYELHSRRVLIRVYYKEIKRNDENLWQWNKANNESIYNEQLSLFLKEKIESYEYHLVALSEYMIRERRQRLCVILDNADQFDEETQSKAFLFGSSLSRKAKCAIIISLREGYYYRWRYKPPFDAFSSNVYHISASSYKEILQKRIDYALKHVNISGTTKGSWGPGEAEINNESVKSFLLSVKGSLFGVQNSGMLRFLHETTFPNIREGLEIFKHFLLSGHTDVAKYILRAQSNPNSVSAIPMWEFVKAIALDNRKYYNHNYSIVYNLFSPVDGSTNHFLKIKLLKFLYIKIEQENFSERAISLNEIKNVFTNAGYKEIIILKELDDLFNNRLIDTSTNLSDVDYIKKTVEQHNIYISLKGYYYLTELKNRFHYLDLISQDTEIFDSEYYSALRQIFPNADDKGFRMIEARKKYTLKFMEYLEQQESKETIESKAIAKNICKEIFDNGLTKDIELLRIQ